MTHGEQFGSDPHRAELNSRAIERAHDTAEALRNEVMDLAYEAVKKFLQDDISTLQELEDMGYPEGAEVTLYVLSDFLSAPKKEGQFTDTLSLQLGRDEEITPTLIDVNDGYPHSKADKLKIYVPVPEDYVVGTSEEIPVPDEIYVERIHDAEDSRSRYVIRRDGMYEYESARDSGEEVVYDDFSDRVFWRRMTMRVDTGLPILSVIAEDLINMDVMPQRSFVIGKAEVHDE